MSIEYNVSKILLGAPISRSYSIAFSKAKHNCPEKIFFSLFLEAASRFVHLPILFENPLKPFDHGVPHRGNGRRLNSHLRGDLFRARSPPEQIKQQSFSWAQFFEGRFQLLVSFPQHHRRLLIRRRNEGVIGQIFQTDEPALLLKPVQGATPGDGEQ
ncbi:MAG: hypothetical protein ACREEM_12400, partial [Blastocatellia bacterium]